MPLVKLIQKLIYDVLSHKYFIVKLGIIFVAILTILHFIEAYLFWHKTNPDLQDVYSYKEIDVVYTWVNGSDPIFIESMKKFSKMSEDFDISRYDDKSELKYSLRSLQKFASWVRHVYIVTNGQVPTWLDLQYDKVTIIPHEDLTTLETLPTFSSPAIETFIHKIPSLSHYFLYLNDDILLGDYIWPDDFLTHSRGIRLYMAWNTPPCKVDCPWSYIGDGACDRQCDSVECQFDGGDCMDDIDPEYREISQIKPASSKKIMGTSKSITNITNHANITDVIWSHNKAYLLRDKRYRQQRSKENTKSKFSRDDLINIKQDAYGASLIHTNRIFNIRYGYKTRKVPAHVPILINKDIMQNLQNDFQVEIAKTRQSKFRNEFDFQYSFSYYHYIMSETKNLTASKIFDEFDTDHSGTWSDRELRTFLTRTNDLPLEWSAIDFFSSTVKTCINKNVEHVSTPPNERYLDSDLPIITKDMVIMCTPLLDSYMENFGRVNRYKYEIIKQSSEYSTFQMLTSNISEVVSALDDIRKFPKKFICINDNLDPNRSEDNELSRALLEDFYMSLFPTRSKFELPNEYRNKFTYISDFKVFKYRTKCLQILIYAVVSTIISLIICRFCTTNRTRRRYMTV